MLATLSRLEKHSRNGGFECAIDAVPAAQWDETAALFADPNYDQIARYSAEQWGRRTSHLLLRRHGESVAGAYAAIIKPPGCSHGVAFVRFGPFWRRRDAAPDLGIYRAAVGALVQEYCIRRGHYLTVVPRPNPEFYHQECEVLSRFGFALRRRVHDPNRYLVDLSHDEHAQRNSLDQKWRYNLRQALNNGFDIRLGQSEEDIRAFQSLHAGMVARKRFHNADMVHLLPRLAAELPQPLRPQIVLAFHRGRPVAGAAIAILGDTAYYVFGGSDGASLSLKGGYALQWWIVRWLSGHGVRWYDLGGEAGEHGLRQFKKGLVGKAGTVIRMHGEYDYWTGTSARLVGDIVYGMRGVQRMIRKLRYRA
ncbi:MAG TPA: GNAT family N-acetyltransferase [Xanthobacteraceae bacterium]|nr:GNAT family N-acetyltransferase [Xanthobacteraceae bacterium]